MTDLIDKAIAAIAARQQGNITRAQLLGLGLDDSAIQRRAKAGRLYRVHDGVYAVGRRPVTPPEHASAAVLACGRAAALSHESAAGLWGLQKHLCAPFHVTVPSRRRPTGIVTHRATIDRRDISHQLGIRITSPARTLLDCAPTLTNRALNRMFNDGRLADGLIKVDTVRGVLDRYPRHPGTARLGWLVESATGNPTRSGHEDDFPAYCRSHDLPEPLIDTSIGGYEVDAVFPEEKVIVELDGWGTHSDRASFESDRERDAALLALGYVTIRITWERLRRQPEREAARLRKILGDRRRQLAA